MQPSGLIAAILASRYSKSAFSIYPCSTFQPPADGQAVRRRAVAVLSPVESLTDDEPPAPAFSRLSRKAQHQRSAPAARPMPGRVLSPQVGCRVSFRSRVRRAIYPLRAGGGAIVLDLCYGS